MGKKQGVLRNIKSLALGAGVALSVIMGLLPAIAHAQSNGLGITPRKDYAINPGTSVSDTLYISNLNSSQDLQVTLKVVDFKAQGQTGTPALELGRNAPQTTWSLKPFIKLPSSVTVSGGNSTQIPFTISVPKNQGAGSYYSAIEYAASAGSSQKNVNIAASSATLIFVTVPGKATELMHLDQFGAFVPSPDDQTGNFSSWFFTSPPKVLAYTLENQGNVAEQPAGSIVIKNMAGKQIKQIAQANSKNELALIDQTRRFEVCIDSTQQTLKDSSGQQNTVTVCKSPSLSPGRYTAELAVFYGLNGNPTQQIVAKTSFWYLPLWFLAIVIAILAIIVFVIYLIIHKIRNHKTKRPRY